MFGSTPCCGSGALTGVAAVANSASAPSLVPSELRRHEPVVIDGARRQAAQRDGDRDRARPAARRGGACRFVPVRCGRPVEEPAAGGFAVRIDAAGDGRGCFADSGDGSRFDRRLQLRDRREFGGRFTGPHTVGGDQLVVVDRPGGQAADDGRHRDRFAPGTRRGSRTAPWSPRAGSCHIRIRTSLIRRPG